MEFKKPPENDNQELDNVVDDSIKEMEEKEEFESFQKLEKDLKELKELPAKSINEKIDNRRILDAISLLTNNVSLFMNRNTAELNAESANENIVIKKLTSIKGDTLDLKSKNFKMRVAEAILFLLLGVCFGFLDDVWIPYIESLGGVFKTVFNFMIK